MKTILPIVSVVLSVAALVCSGLAHWRTERVAAMVVEARERELIEWLDTQVRPMMADFGVKYPDDPQRIEDVLSPFFTTLKGFGSPIAEP